MAKTTVDTAILESGAVKVLYHGFFPGVVRFAILFLLLNCLSSVPSAHPQLYTGSVAGNVTDPSSRAIVDATITLIDKEKGFTFSARSDTEGRYILRSVPPGVYEISVEAGGFERQHANGIKIDVNQNASLDFALKIGSTVTTVDVSANAIRLQTEDAVTGQVVSRKFVNDLPLNGRAVLDLTSLAAGVTETNVGGGGLNFISNGSRSSTADLLIDGVTSTNFEQNSGVVESSFEPSVDAVEEFKVQQSNFSAEFGFAGATIINVVTRSGTNQYHGSAYEFLRNQVLDANGFFANKNGVPIPPLRRNNFGGTFGGPIRKEKTFFFFDYEGTRTRDFSSAQAGVPTARERTGDFGELCTAPPDPNNLPNPNDAAGGAGGGSFDANGLCSNPAGQLYDPYSTPNQTPVVRNTAIPFNNLALYASPGSAALAGTAFQVRSPGAPGNLIDPVALRLLQLFPSPTLSGPAVDIGVLQTRNFFASGTNSGSNDQFDLKVDHRFNDRDLLSVKYAQRSGRFHSFNCFGNLADACTTGPILTTGHLFTVNHTHTFSPTLVLTLSYGYNRRTVNEEGIQGDFPNLDASAADQLGLPSYINRSGFRQYPSITLSGYASAGPNNIGSQTFSIIREGSDSHDLTGAISWVRGAHEFKFGAEGRLHRINYAQPGWPAGQFSFDFTGTSQSIQQSDPANPHPLGGDALASFLTGVGSSGLYEVPLHVSTQSFRIGEFIQDNWKITPKLTLNLGLRYEISTPRTERFNKLNFLDPNVLSPIDTELTSSARQILGGRTLRGAEVFTDPNNRSNYSTDYHDIQPRFGLAYKLPHSLVFRGGYGIYYSTPRSSASGTGPFGFQGFSQITPYLPSFQGNGILPGAVLSDPFPGGGPLLPPGSSLGARNDLGFDAVGPVRAISHNTPYEQAWSAGFQEELPGKILIDATYVGKKGTHLYFGGFRQLNFLGSRIEQLTTDQIRTLVNSRVTNPFQGIITDPNSPLSSDQISAVQAQLPFPQYTGFLGDSPPIANSIYHAGQFRIEREFANGLQFLVTYVVSKSIDDASAQDDSVAFLGGGTADGGSTLAVQNPNNLRAERAVSVFDIPQVLQISYVYSLPIGRGRRFGRSLHPVLDAFIGGWQTNGIWRFDSGRPLLPLLQNVPNPIPTYGQRPNLTGTLRRAPGSIESLIDSGFFVNPGALSAPADFTLGTAPRTITSVRQPGARNASLSVFKEFPLARIREGARLEFRVESFNTFNHPQFAGPSTVVGSSDFGRITSTVNGPRELQLALKLYF